MNDEQQAELRDLRVAQRTLTLQLRALDERLAKFERLAAGEAVVAPLIPPPPAPLPVAPRTPRPAPEPDTPPPLPPLPAKAGEEVLYPAGSGPADTFATAQARWGASEVSDPPPFIPAPAPAVTGASSPVSPVPPLPVPSVAPVTPARRTESLEMRIGSTWLVYVGVVLGLTALAFFGNYLYHNIVPHLGPAGKVALLYVGAGGLAGAGAWLERSRQARENSRLRAYARVVLAGGLAAVYYVTYAAHYFENLRVIDNSLVAGAALLAWTAFMVFLAHRRNSETIATVGILLAYYTAAINEGIAAFTLFSNLALTGGVVFLLRRHLWRVFPFASLLATFGSYAFWTYYHSVLGWRGELGTPPVHAQHGPGGFWIECAFLGIYWALFTWAAFTAGEAMLPSFRRAGFVSLNNGAFYGLVTWLVVGAGPGGFWKWSVGFGAVLLVLAEASRRLPRPQDPRTEDVYLLQGVLAVTTGFVAYFDGWQLGLVLAVEAVTLLAASGRRSSRLLLGCSWLSALLAFFWTMGGFGAFSAAGTWITPLGVGAFLVGAAGLAQRLRQRQPQAEAPDGFRQMLEPSPAYYSLLGSVVWLCLIGGRAPTDAARLLLFAGTAVALTASVYVWRLRPLTLYAQAFLGAGFLLWLATEELRLRPSGGVSGWPTLGLLVASLALGHWWQRLPGVTGWNAGKLSRFFNGGDAVLVVAVIFGWFQTEVWSTRDADGVRVAEAAGLALVIFGYAVATRYRALGVASQGLLLASIGFFFALTGNPWRGNLSERWLALVPLVGVLAMLAAMRLLAVPTRFATDFRPVTFLYEGAATILFLDWAAHYLPLATLPPVYTGVGAVVFALGVRRNGRRWLILSVVPTLAGLWAFFVLEQAAVHGNFLNLIVVACLAGQQQFGRRALGDRLKTWLPGKAQAVLMGATVFVAWMFVTARVEQWHDSSITLAAGWSVFAAMVFAAGWFLRERVYRWLALAVLAATLGHVVWFDLTRLDSLGKAISFFALAVVILGVSLLYNRYQDKFRDLL